MLHLTLCHESASSSSAGAAIEAERDRKQSVDMVNNPLYAGGASTLRGGDGAEYDSRTCPATLSGIGCQPT